ncbi:PIR Superfamily Protein [Plasmodium ovale wallikeri]|uniref:PIR Superfamily Protein n=2 Tax=Plasmodium ovale TaxID=36330 RepID=A0A1A9AH59_PLAOA|nr:PIR Superfamily Protein [Plasmodium ovale wallikeri]SBT55532.1 PIR Superfamily Protein [Plasmodium ovale wallikeri]SBT74123.1 PIR protein [Plasmodium ovale]
MEDEDADDYIEGEDYYPYISLFQKYLDNFNEVISGSVTNDAYTQYCDNFYRTKFGNNENFLSSCKKVAKYLNHLNKGELTAERFNRCKHLNYLLNSNEEYNTIPNYNTSHLIDAYEELTKKINHACFYHIKKINEDTLRKLKDINNMHEYFNKIKDNSTSCSTECCSHASSCTKIYDSYITNCSVASTDHLCNELVNFKSEYDNIMQSIECQGVSKILTPPKEQYSSVTLLIPLIIILVISVFSFIFYKFTPLGSWLDLQIAKKKKIWNYLQKESPLLYNSNSENLPSHINTFNIEYQSNRN